MLFHDNDGQIVISKKTRMPKIATHSVKRWAQGNIFCFSARDTIYNRLPDLHEPWLAKKVMQRIIIDDARPSKSAERDSPRDPGYIRAKIWGGQNGNQILGQFETTQDGLIRMLISGEMPRDV